MLIPQPYLLFPGDVTDPLAAKTARGIQVWRPEQCVGELRLPGCSVTLGLEELDIATANAGGYLPQHWLPPITLSYSIFAICDQNCRSAVAKSVAANVC